MAVGPTNSVRDELCLILDLEGFTVGKEFQVRELGYYSWQGDRGSYFFDVTTPYKRVKDNEKKQIHYVSRCISGLPYRPAPCERPVHHQRAVRGLVRRLYREFRTDVRTVVGFKGGHFERDILLAAKIPYRNIEDWGCPKYDRLRDQITVTSDTIDVGCGCHQDPTIHHCPQVECELFWKWTRNNVFC